MPDKEYGLERYLSPAGQQTIGSAIEVMRRVGSSQLQQEHLMMVFSGMYRQFSNIGAGPDFFNKMFDVDPAAARYSGDFTVSDEVRELVISATVMPSQETRRASPLHLLEATIQHPTGRLRKYLLHAQMLYSGGFDEDAPENLLEEINGRKKEDRSYPSVA